MTRSSSSAASAGSSFTASDNPTNPVSILLRTITVAVYCVPELVRSIRMRRWSTSTTTVPSSPSPWSLMASLLSAPIASSQQQRDDLVYALIRAAQAAGWVWNDHDEKFSLRHSSTSPTTVPSPSSLGMASMSATPAASLYSMPDLLPLVVFLNNNWEPLEQELQRERENRLRVELTGPGGFIKYSAASMKDGYTNSDGDWVVRFDNYDDPTDISIPNFIRTVAGLELRVGGVVVLPLEDTTFFAYAAEEAGFDLTCIDELQMGRIGFANNKGIRVYGRIGPIRYGDYLNLFRPNLVMTVPGFVQFLENQREHDLNDTVLLPQLDISSAVFPKSQITGIMSVLQSMGGSTE